MNQTQDNGFLSDPSLWSEAFCKQTAQAEGITLTQDHWRIVATLREHFAKYQTSLPMRQLIKLLQTTYGPHFNSLYLQQLFPQSPAVQAAKIAGLPRPKRCI